MNFLIAFICDVEFIDSTIKTAVQKFGKIDYLANVAGVIWFDKDRSLLDIDLDIWDEIFRINLRSMTHIIRATVPHIRKSGGGAMVHFSTIQCLRGDVIPQDAYSASKAGVGAISKSLAMQLSRYGIRSNTIFPGPTETPMQARWNTKDKIAEVSKKIPLGRIGKPEELADAALYLLSDGASYITGSELIVDGGVLLKS